MYNKLLKKSDRFSCPLFSSPLFMLINVPNLHIAVCVLYKFCVIFCSVLILFFIFLFQFITL